MLTYSTASIFDSPHQTIVNPVNCAGVMGAGLAKEFKARFPRMFEQHKRHCGDGRLELGKLWLCTQSLPWVLCFPTKGHWRELSTMEGVSLGLANFARTYRERGISSAAFPALGAGLGGLDWCDVKALMERQLGAVEAPVTVHLPR